MPGQVRRAQIHVHENFRPSGRLRRRPRPDDDLLRGLRDRIWRRELRAVALKVLPVEDDALEPILVALFEVARIGRFCFVARFVHCGHVPVAVRTGRSALASPAPAASTAPAAASGRRAAGDLHGNRRRVVGIDLPPLAIHGDLQPSVIRPGRVRHVLAIVLHATRLGRAVRWDEPRVRAAAVGVGLFEAGRDGVGDPLAVGREGGVADRLDAVVVLDRERAACGGPLCAGSGDTRRERPAETRFHHGQAAT